MKTTQIVQFEPQKQTWHMYRAMVGLGLICGIVIVSVYQLTLPVIRANKEQLLRQSVFELFPDADTFRGYEFVENGHFVPLSSDPERAFVYAVFDNKKNLTGFAVKAQGMGYQDTIELLYGYSPERQEITGFKVVFSRETPGLGSRIETDQAYIRNFAALPVGLDSSGEKLEHEIEVVKPGRKQHPWQVDTITGATISSAAVARIVATNAQRWVIKLANQQQEFKINDHIQ